MDSGRIIAEGKPEDLKKTYAPKSVISVELAKSEDYSKALETLGNRLNPKDIVAKENFLRIYVEDSDVTLSSVAFELFKAGIKIISMRITKPTL